MSHIKRAIDAYEKALEYGRQSLKVHYFLDVPYMINSITSEMFQLQSSLISAYCFLASFVPFNEAQPLLKKARQIRKNFRNQGQRELFVEASTALDAIELHFEKERLNSLPIRSRRVEDYRSQKASELRQAIIEKTDTIHEKGKTFLSLKTRVQLKQQHLNSFISLMEAEWHNKVVDGLIEMEKEIEAHLTAEGASQSPALETIYEHLWVLLGQQAVMNNFWAYIPAFLMAENLEGAIQRIDLLKNIEKNKCGTASYLTRSIAAGLKNLRGDHEEWLSLEAELQQKEQQKKERKKESSQRKSQAKTCANHTTFSY